MTSKLARRRKQTAELSTDLAELSSKAADFAARARSENTRRAYRFDWSVFSRWCALHDVSPLPALPSTIVAFITDMASSRAASTIDRYLSTITKVHKIKGLHSPVLHPAVVDVRAGIRRTIGTRPKQKKAAVLNILRRMCDTCDTSKLIGVRDRAVLLLCWAGAFRRSELIAVQYEDVEFVDKGVIIHIARSKTDQEGKGARVEIPYGSELCPVRSLKRWLKMSGIRGGALFRPIRCGVAAPLTSPPEKDGGKLIARIVKRAAQRAGLSPDLYGGHSLRAGLATHAASVGKPDRLIMRQGRWKDPRTLEKYIRDGEAFRENAASGIGL